MSGRRGAFRRRAGVMARGSTAVGGVQGAADALVAGVTLDTGATPMSGDPIESDPNRNLLAVDPDSGDPIESDPNRSLLAVGPDSGDPIESDPNQQVIRAAVTASRLIGTDEEVRVIRVPAQVLLVQKKGLRAPTAHYVLLGPISGAP